MLANGRKKSLRITGREFNDEKNWIQVFNSRPATPPGYGITAIGPFVYSGRSGCGKFHVNFTGLQNVLVKFGNKSIDRIAPCFTVRASCIVHRASCIVYRGILTAAITGKNACNSGCVRYY